MQTGDDDDDDVTNDDISFEDGLVVDEGDDLGDDSEAIEDVPAESSTSKRTAPQAFSLIVDPDINLKSPALKDMVSTEPVVQAGPLPGAAPPPPVVASVPNWDW